MINTLIQVFGVSMMSRFLSIALVSGRVGSNFHGSPVPRFWHGSTVCVSGLDSGVSMTPFIGGGAKVGS